MYYVITLLSTCCETAVESGGYNDFPFETFTTRDVKKKKNRKTSLSNRLKKNEKKKPGSK